MNRTDAAVLAGKIGASFPSSRVSQDTLAEWTTELSKIPYERGLQVVEWLRDNFDSAPSFRQIRLAMARTKPPKLHGADEPITPGHHDPCIFCGQPVPEGPGSAMRYNRDIDRWENAHLDCDPGRSEAHSKVVV